MYHLHGLIFELKERMNSRQDQPVNRQWQLMSNAINIHNFMIDWLFQHLNCILLLCYFNNNNNTTIIADFTNMLLCVCLICLAFFLCVCVYVLFVIYTYTYIYNTRQLYTLHRDIGLKYLYYMCTITLTADLAKLYK
jgi:hypothetical protein